jgi:hypothetical protein
MHGAGPPCPADFYGLKFILELGVGKLALIPLKSILRAISCVEKEGIIFIVLVFRAGRIGGSYIIVCLPMLGLLAGRLTVGAAFCEWAREAAPSVGGAKGFRACA